MQSQPSPTPRPGPGRRSRPARALLAAGIVCAVVVVAARPWYYRWALSGPRMAVVVYCDTAEFAGRITAVYALYDKVALSPLARALGMYQNRPGRRVRAFYPVQAAGVRVTPYSVTLPDVPAGPLARVMIWAGERRFSADVDDRTLKDGTLYVRVGGRADPDAP